MKLGVKLQEQGLGLAWEGARSGPSIYSRMGQEGHEGGGSHCVECWEGKVEDATSLDESLSRLRTWEACPRKWCLHWELTAGQGGWGWLANIGMPDTCWDAPSLQDGIITRLYGSSLYRIQAPQGTGYYCSPASLTFWTRPWNPPWLWNH